MRDALNTDLTHLNASFLRMQSLAVEQLAMLRAALSAGSFAGLGDRLKALDRGIDDLERDLESHCLTVIARHQPLAGDLRFVLMIFKSLADLERVGDYASHTGRELEALSASVRSGPLSDVLPLLNLLSEMLEKLAYAFAERDQETARLVIRLDDDVDALYEQMQRASLTRILEDPRDLQSAMRIARLSRHMERLGDHIQNVAERVEAYLSSRPGGSAISRAG